MKKQIIRFALVLVMLITFLGTNENVQAAKSVKIKLEKPSVTLYAGEYTAIKPKLKNATKAQKEKAKFTYKSSNKSVAQVTKKGVVNAKKKGTAVITVTSNVSKKQKATFKVVVKAKPAKSSIKLNKNSANIKVGETVSIKVKSVTGLSSKKVKYESADKSIATVSSSGKVTGKKEGKTTITVKSAVNKKVKVKYSVTVLKNEERQEDIKQERYSYAAILKLMVSNPEQFWDLSDRKNQFAIADINNDGVEELLVRYDTHGVSVGGEFKEIDIYQYGKLVNTVSGGKTEFYNDGTIIAKYINELYKGTYVYIYNKEEMIAHGEEVYIEEEYDDEEFLVDKDIDGDGYVYIWNDWENNCPTEDKYLTKEEYNEKINEIRKNKKKIDIKWKNISEANIDEATMGVIEDKKVVNKIENNDYLAAYIKIFDNEYEKLDSLYQVIKYIAFSSNKGLSETMMTDLLPSSKISGNDYEVTIYEIKKEDFSTLSKEAFNNAYTMEDLMKNKWVKDNGNGTLEVRYEWMGVDESTIYKNYVLSTEKKNGKIIVKGIYVEDFERLKADYFECVLEENANSPIDGYKIISIKKEPLYEHSIYAYDF